MASQNNATVHVEGTDAGATTEPLTAKKVVHGKHLGEGYIEITGLDPEGPLYALVPLNGDGKPGDGVVASVTRNLTDQWARVENHGPLRAGSEAEKPPAHLLRKHAKPEDKPKDEAKGEAKDEDGKKAIK